MSLAFIPSDTAPDMGPLLASKDNSDRKPHAQWSFTKKSVEVDGDIISRPQLQWIHTLTGETRKAIDFWLHLCRKTAAIGGYDASVGRPWTDCKTLDGRVGMVTNELPDHNLQQGAIRSCHGCVDAKPTKIGPKKWTKPKCAELYTLSVTVDDYEDETARIYLKNYKDLKMYSAFVEREFIGQNNGKNLPLYAKKIRATLELDNDWPRPQFEVIETTTEELYRKHHALAQKLAEDTAQYAEEQLRQFKEANGHSADSVLGDDGIPF
jgi:hypothetical protein